MKAFDLSGKVAIITGGGSGIGEQMSHVFAAAGALVQIIEYKRERGEAVVAAITEKGGSASFHQGDVSKQDSMIECCKSIVEKNGPN